MVASCCHARAAKVVWVSIPETQRTLNGAIAPRMPVLTIVAADVKRPPVQCRRPPFRRVRGPMRIKA